MAAVADFATKLNDVAIAETLSPDERVQELRRLRNRVLDARADLDAEDPGRLDLTALAGHADTYIGANEMEREADAMDGALDHARIREDAEIRDLLIAQGVASADEMDAAGWPSHQQLDDEQADGSLAESALTAWREMRETAAPEPEPEAAAPAPEAASVVEPEAEAAPEPEAEPSAPEADVPASDTPPEETA